MHTIRAAVIAALVIPTALLGQAAAGSGASSAPPKVGPAHGTVIVVGGGTLGAENLCRRSRATTYSPTGPGVSVPRMW